jgi:hypothetical protein
MTDSTRIAPANQKNAARRHTVLPALLGPVPSGAQSVTPPRLSKRSLQDLDRSSILYAGLPRIQKGFFFDRQGVRKGNAGPFSRFARLRFGNFIYAL